MSLMTKSKLMVFDLDGTLVDSVPDIAAAVNRMLAARGLPPLTSDAVAAMVGDGLKPLIARAFAAVGATPDAAAGDEYLADYESNVAVETRLFDGIPAALHALEQAGWRLAVCTNKPERAARLLLDALGIADRFSAIGGGDSFAAHKPDPMHLQGTIAAAGGDARFTLMVGDHTNDVSAATGAGVRAVFAGWGYGRPGMEEGAVAIAPRPGDLPGIAARLLNI
ncbi:MAG TPA: phosphoglycolate phosphatase [Acetobacteraceae bacterium]|nr:phosphoglycolate phosphatase [Acetobacteraceae bacterium]